MNETLPSPEQILASLGTTGPGCDLLRWADGERQLSGKVVGATLEWFAREALVFHPEVHFDVRSRGHSQVGFAILSWKFRDRELIVHVFSAKNVQWFRAKRIIDGASVRSLFVGARPAEQLLPGGFAEHWGWLLEGQPLVQDDATLLGFDDQAKHLAERFRAKGTQVFPLHGRVFTGDEIATEIEQMTVEGRAIVAVAGLLFQAMRATPEKI